jgi:hypothetical protein
MPGSLRKRGNSWELRAYAGTDPETGKRHWVSATVKGSRRAAQQELAELVSRIDYPRRMTSQATVAKLLMTGSMQSLRTGRRRPRARPRASSTTT